MLRNSEKGKIRSVEFLSYTGKYPNLCSGTLTIKVDGETWCFNDNLSLCKGANTGHSFWHSGGSCTIREDGEDNVEKKEWIIDELELPKELRPLAEEIDYVFNKNVRYGCCGGCL